MNNKYDLVVVGEVCLDTLMYPGESSERVGGAFYSAYAGKRYGASTSILGVVGESDFEQIDEILLQHNINTDFLISAPGKTTQFILGNVDEVLPQTAVMKRDILFEFSFENIPETQAVLFYPTPNLENNIKLFDDAIKAIDVQYDLEYIMNLTCLSEVDIIFISGSDSPHSEGIIDDKIKYFLDQGVQIVVTKYGPGGSRIFQCGKDTIDIPAYITNYECTVGAGDVYNSVFLLSHKDGLPIEIAGNHASVAASSFIESREIPTTYEPWDFQELIATREKVFLPPDQAQNIRVYLAGPFFSDGERLMVEHTYKALTKCNLSVFSPFHSLGIVKTLHDSFRAYNTNVTELEQANLVVALLDYEDSGTVWECGYAKSKDIPVWSIHTSNKSLNSMVKNGSSMIAPSIRCIIDSVYKEFGGKNDE